jgi:thioesterase domain-containing protein/acyl carrier protein
MVLAGYMIPSAFVPLKKIPLTVNGKVDRRSLPVPERQHFAGGQDIVLPKNELEEMLLGIWENVLKVSPISVEDDFFDIGGHSLIAVELFDEIREKVGIQLPLAALLEAPNIREMAGYIEEAKRKERVSSPVAVKMNESSSGRPFFCIHGHFGNILFLKELANKLGHKRPFYGIQSVGRNGSEEPLLSIEQMADRYLSEMRKIQPAGPYSFGGYCYGTLVARVMAKKLDDMDESYYPIIMIDPQPDLYERVLNKKVVSAFRKAANQQRVEVHRGKVGENNSLVEKSRYLMIKAGNKLINKFNEIFLSLLVQARRYIPLPIPGYLREVEVCNLVAHNQCSSKLTYDFHADVEIILSRQLLSKYSKNPTKDWSGFTRGNMNIHKVNDDGIIMSDLMFKPPYVDQLAEIIGSIWEREQIAPGRSSADNSKMTGS